MNKYLYLLGMMVISVILPAHMYAQVHYRNTKVRTYTNEAGTAYLDEYLYYDGLGRQLQTIKSKITPNKEDLVIMREIDIRGNLSAEWLPASFTNTTEYKDPALVKKAAIGLNTDSKPHTSYEYENSPLKRVTTTYGEGNQWHSNKKAIKTSYFTNVAIKDSLDCFNMEVHKAKFPALNFTKKPNYTTGSLSVTRIEDEEGCTTFTFKNKLDQVILVRKVLVVNEERTFADTYYVYDDFNNLCAVLPPKAVADNFSTIAIEQYAYLYRYDDRGRLAAKKLPGCEWIYYVYDKRDNLIYTQDGELRKSYRWHFSFPDEFGRIAVQGICNDPINAANDPLKDKQVIVRWTGGNTSYKGYQVDGLGFEHTHLAYKVYYYDNYDFMGNAGIPAITDTHFKPETISGYGKQYTGSSKGLITGTWTTCLDGFTRSGGIYKVMYYDDRGQLIQVKSNNHLAGGIEKEYLAYNFNGLVTKRQLVHMATGKTTQTEVYTYTYDHALRLSKKTHKLNSNPEVVIEQNSYDELGRLITIEAAGQSRLKRTYSYNVRSWPTQIQNVLFWEKLQYNPNGHIKHKEWGQANKVREYAYEYDTLSRLERARFKNWGALKELYNVAFTYDLHGNVKTVNRVGYGGPDSGHSAVDVIIDMKYNGNQLYNVFDMAVWDKAYPTNQDFRDYSRDRNIKEYTYDANGAMTQDLSRGISQIQYNYLSLPHILDIKNPVAEARNTYTYAADGTKLSVNKAWNPSPSSAPEIGSAVNVAALTNSKRTDYVGNKVYENGALKMILLDGGYYDWTAKKYYFYIKDYQGNNRVVADTNGTVIQNTTYYPYGLAFGDHTGTDQQPYKYNGKEIDPDNGLHLYDYHARQYDPSLGRFTSMDPAAEEYYSTSPYAYCLNNPVRYVDKDGKRVWDFVVGFAHSLTSNLSVGTYPISTYHPRNASHYNSGRDAGDIVSMGMGAAEVYTGGNMTLGGAASMVITGGTSAPVSGTMTATGAAVATHGSAVIWKAGQSLNSKEGRIQEASSTSQGKSVSNSDSRTANSSLRVDSNGNKIPDPEAAGTAHTQLGTRQGRNSSYKQAREFDSSGKPIRDIDFTDHGRKDHTNPHQHPYKDNPTGGTRQRDNAEPLKFIDY